MAIGVTGATGGVGSAVISHLLSRADPPPVLALARRPDAIPSTPGLTVRRADYDDPPSLREAMAGVGRLVFVASDGDGEPMRRHHEHMIAAAGAAGVGHVVYTSIVDVAPDSGFYYAAIHRETEALLAQSGFDHCLARTSIFADFFLETWIEPALERGELALPTGGGRMSLVSRADVARAVAEAALARREGVLELTGPAALTAAEIAQTFEAVSARPLRYVDLDETDYRRRLAAEGNPEWLIEAFSSMSESVREGRFEVVSPDGERLTGAASTPFAEFLGSSEISASARSPRTPSHRRRR